MELVGCAVSAIGFRSLYQFFFLPDAHSSLLSSLLFLGFPMSNRRALILGPEAGWMHTLRLNQGGGCGSRTRCGGPEFFQRISFQRGEYPANVAFGHQADFFYVTCMYDCLINLWSCSDRNLEPPVCVVTPVLHRGFTIQ